MTKPQGKPCPRCNSPMADLRSLNKRQCTGCGRHFAWELSKGQRPLLGSNRADRGIKQ